MVHAGKTYDDLLGKAIELGSGLGPGWQKQGRALIKKGHNKRNNTQNNAKRERSSVFANPGVGAKTAGAKSPPPSRSGGGEEAVMASSTKVPGHDTKMTPF